MTDADVTERLEQIRDQKAEYVNEEPRPLADGDYAVVSLESLSGVAEKISQDELMLKIGDEATMPAFTENLRGASPDDQREFEVTYPEDYERKNLAGRTVKFRATVKAVRRKELPELNDEFAKDLGDFQTLEELKETIRKNIQREREHQRPGRRQAPVAGQAGGRARFPRAGGLHRPADRDERRKPVAGVWPRRAWIRKDLKLDWQKVRDAQKEKAARDVKASLLLDKIAEREAIGATQEEVDREVQRIARQQREAVAVTRAKLQKDGAIGKIAGNIRTEKTLSLAVRAGSQGSRACLRAGRTRGRSG